MGRCKKTMRRKDREWPINLQGVEKALGEREGQRGREKINHMDRYITNLIFVPIKYCFLKS